MPESYTKKIKPDAHSSDNTDFDQGADGLLEQKRIDLLKNKVDFVVEKARQLNPDKLNPYWIFNNCSKEHRVIKDNFRTLEGEINWQVFSDLLPKDLKDKWTYEKQKVWSSEKAIGVATKILEKEKPGSFNQEWLEKNDYGLYRHLKRKLKNKTTGKIEWENFIEQLPEEWKNKWTRGIRDEKRREMSKDRTKFSFESAVKRLNDVLTANNPRFFSSEDIKSLDRSLYSYFSRHVKKKDGSIDWKKIIEDIDEKFQSRFQPPKIFKEAYPAKQYEDQSEVDAVLEMNRDKLLTFFGIKNPSDRMERNEICLELIGLAKKGNLAAEDKLMEYLEILAMDWIEKDSLLDVYKIDTDDLRERMKKCIYLYRENGPAGFIGYLYVNLKKQAMGLNRGYNKIELDSSFFGDGPNKHDRIDLSENSWR